MPVRGHPPRAVRPQPAPGFHPSRAWGRREEPAATMPITRRFSVRAVTCSARARAHLTCGNIRREFRVSKFGTSCLLITLDQHLADSDTREHSHCHLGDRVCCAQNADHAQLGLRIWHCHSEICCFVDWRDYGSRCKWEKRERLVQQQLRELRGRLHVCCSACRPVAQRGEQRDGVVRAPANMNTLIPRNLPPQTTNHSSSQSTERSRVSPFLSVGSKAHHHVGRLGHRLEAVPRFDVPSITSRTSRVRLARKCHCHLWGYLSLIPVAVPARRDPISTIVDCGTQARIHCIQQVRRCFVSLTLRA